MPTACHHWTINVLRLRNDAFQILRLGKSLPVGLGDNARVICTPKRCIILVRGLFVINITHRSS